MTWWGAMLWGGFGGLFVVAVELLQAVKARGQLPWVGPDEPIATSAYATSLLVRILIGGGLAWAASSLITSPLFAVAVGVAAPLALEKLSAMALTLLGSGAEPRETPPPVASVLPTAAPISAFAAPEEPAPIGPPTYAAQSMTPITGQAERTTLTHCGQCWGQVGVEDRFCRYCGCALRKHPDRKFGGPVHPSTPVEETGGQPDGYPAQGGYDPQQQYYDPYQQGGYDPYSAWGGYPMGGSRSVQPTVPPAPASSAPAGSASEAASYRTRGDWWRGLLRSLASGPWKES